MQRTLCGGHGWLLGPLPSRPAETRALWGGGGGECSSSGGNVVEKQGNEDKRKPHPVPLQPATAEDPKLFTGKRGPPEGCSEPFQRQGHGGQHLEGTSAPPETKSLALAVVSRNTPPPSGFLGMRPDFARPLCREPLQGACAGHETPGPCGPAVPGCDRGDALCPQAR